MQSASGADSSSLNIPTELSVSERSIPIHGCQNIWTDFVTTVSNRLVHATVSHYSVPDPGLSREHYS
jgi:hypothetical protein